MVFGIQKLQDQVFCLTEERDYFQGKFLEQVSEIQALKEELRKAKKQISRMRDELIKNSCSQLSPPATPKHAAHDDDDSTLSSHDEDHEQVETADDILNQATTTEDDSEHDNDDSDNDSAKDIRQSAEKLLQWATYRSSVTSSRNSSSHSSIASPNASQTPASLLDSVPKTIQSSSLDKEEDGTEETHSTTSSDVESASGNLSEQLEQVAV